MFSLQQTLGDFPVSSQLWLLLFATNQTHIRGHLRLRYADYVDPSLWRVVADLYTRESARLSGLPKESPLSVCVDAGCTAIPKLMKVREVHIEFVMSQC